MYHYDIREFAAPSAEPLLVGGSPKELDITHHVQQAAGAETSYLKTLVVTARRYCENATARCFIERTLDLLLPGGFPSNRDYIFSASEIRLPRAPILQSGGIVHVKYLDSNGTQQTLVAGTDYVSVVRGEMGIVMPAWGKSWPSTRVWPDSSGNYPVEVRFKPGYGSSGLNVPENYRQAMALLIANWFMNREALTDIALDELPDYGVKDLLAQDAFHPW